MVRLVLIVLLLSGLTLVALQNWSVALPLVFLGLRSQSLPLGIWLLIAIGLGALSTLAISALVNLSSFFSTTPFKRRVAPGKKSRPRRTAQSRSYQDFDEERDWDTPPQETPPNRAASDRRHPTRSSEDYFDEDLLDDEDDFLDEREPRSQRKTSVNPPPSQNDDRDFDRFEEPKRPPSRPQTDSGYSHSYRDPANFGTGRREAVYDAEYRVIVPPQDGYVPPFYQEPEINRQPSETVVSQAGFNDDEDWGFDFDEEDFIDDDEPDRRSKS